MFHPGFKLWWEQALKQVSVETLRALKEAFLERYPELLDIAQVSDQKESGAWIALVEFALRQQRLLLLSEILEAWVQVVRAALPDHKFVTSFSEQLPPHVLLTPEGFLYYKQQPLRRLESTEPEVEPKSEPEAESEVQGRRKKFQEIRKKRLRLLAQWESL